MRNLLFLCLFWLVGCDVPQEATQSGDESETSVIENKESVVPPEKRPMRRHLPKNLAPSARKLVLTSSDQDTMVSIQLEYASEKNRESIEQNLVDLGVNIKAVQQETRNMSLETSSANLEAIAAIDGVVYVDANSKLRR